MSKSQADKVQRPNRAKKKRTPLGARNKLTFDGVEKGYKYRFINDSDDRIKAAIEGGYEHVIADEEAGDTRVAEASSMGSQVSKAVGNNTTAYLMRIPLEYYEEDQAAKQVKVDATEQTMNPDASKGQYGEGLTND